METTMTQHDPHRLDDPMTTEVAMLRAMAALRDRIIRCPDKRDQEALGYLREILDQQGEFEPGTIYLTRAIDVWVRG